MNPVIIDEEFIKDNEKGSGKYVLFAGLLRAAHENGLRSMDPEVLVFPTAENDYYCVVKSTAFFRVKDEEGEGDPYVDEDNEVAYRDIHQENYSALGEAQLKYMPDGFEESLVRFAETRAHSRVLRWALGVTMVAKEELPMTPRSSGMTGTIKNADISPSSMYSNEALQGSRQTKIEPRAAVRPSVLVGKVIDEDEVPPPWIPEDREIKPAYTPPSSGATPAQIKAIYSIGRNELQLNVQQVDARCKDKYGVIPAELNKRQASEYIDSLRSSAN